MVLVFSQGFLYYAILPSTLIIFSLIVCGSSRPKRESEKKSKDGKKRKKVSSTARKKRKSRSKKSKSTRSGKKKSRKSDSKSKSRIEHEKGSRSARASKRMKSSSSTKSIENLSSKPRRSSRLERFPCSGRRVPSVGTVNSAKSGEASITYSNRDVARSINETPKNGIKLEPQSLHWNVSGGLQKVYLKNLDNDRKAIKVKCSDNQLYRVSPVYTFIAPNQTLGFDVVRQNGGPKIDKMVFLWTMADESDRNVSALFNDVSSYPMLVLPLIVNSSPK